MTMSLAQYNLPDQRVTAYSHFWYRINLFLTSHCQTRRETLLQPFLSRRFRATYTTNTDDNYKRARDLGRTTRGTDRHTRHRYTRDIVTTHKKPNPTMAWWRCTMWCGPVRWHGAAKCEIHHGPPSASTSFFCLFHSFSPPSPSLFHANSLSVWSWITPTTPP